jgi:hypothetical protein
MADYLGYEEAFKQAGIRYTAEPDWRNRGHGDIISPNFIVVHHTAGGNDAGDIRIVRDGRSDLPGPLSQLLLKRNGEPHIVAAGVAWHAGYGPAMWGAPAGNGNYYSIGIEGISNGRNDWTDAQRREYPRVVAALLKHMKLPADRWIFHRDYNKRDGKIDPVGFDAGWFRDEVNRHYNATNKTAIEECYDRNPALGKKTIAERERPTADGIGRLAYYENGHILWHPAHGAHALIGPIFKKYAENNFEVGFLGYPVGDQIPLRDKGYAQGFQNGSIYGSERYGAFIVNGAIGDAWAASKWEGGPYGYPISDEKKLPDAIGVLQDYETGHVYYSPGTGAKFIQGLIWDEFSNQGFERGLGYPLTDEMSTPVKEGRYNHFQNGSIYYKWGTGRAFTIKGTYEKVYSDLGWENSRLGFPISNEYAHGAGTRQDFEGGSIEIDPTDTEIIINGQYIATQPSFSVPPTETVVEKPKGYQPTAEELELLPEVEKRGGISFFANHNDPTTKGRKMGISGESADQPQDQWFCAMRFGYVGTMPNPSNPAWIKPRNRTDISEAEKFRLKKYLVGRKLKVTNPANGKSIVVRPADWGPGVPKRNIDVSETAIKALGAQTDTQVVVEWVDPSTNVGPV